MLLQERNRRQPSKVVRFPQQHLEDTASYSHPPSSVFCHFSVRRRSSSSAAATDSTRVRLQVSPGRPYRPLLLELLMRPPRPLRLLQLKIHHCKKDNTRTSWAQISSNKDVKIWEVLQPQQQQSPFSSMGTTRTMSLPPPPFQLDTAICSSFCRHQKEWRQWWRNYNNTLPFECLWFSFK